MSLSLSHSGLRVSVQVGVRAVGVSSKSVCVRAMAASGQWVDGGQPRHVQAARIGQLVYEGESTDQHMVQPLLVHLRVVRNRCMCACCAKRCVCQQAVGGVSPACRRHDASLSTSSDADVKQAQRNSGSERKKGLTGMAACTPFQQRDVVICEQRVTVAEPHAGHGARQRLVGWSESALIETNFSKSFHDVNDSQTRPTTNFASRCCNGTGVLRCCARGAPSRWVPRCIRSFDYLNLLLSWHTRQRAVHE
jgi:hypothetical protein